MAARGPHRRGARDPVQLRLQRALRREDRHYDPWQAGGALLDIGVYNLSPRTGLCSRRRPAPSCRTVAEAKFAPSGVDAARCATLRFAGDVHLQFRCGFDAHADNSLRIFGERGLITMPARFWEATAACCSVDGEGEQRVERPFAINGFEGEILEAMACIRAGRHDKRALPRSPTRSPSPAGATRCASTSGALPL
jgi:predicted dehydrogenase